MTRKERTLVIWAALLALFLGALDALIMSAAMPSVVAELGDLSLYGWVYSAYFLTRAVSLPIFGKLADLYNIKKLFLFSIITFGVSSLAAGFAPNMEFLVVCRAFQGIGAGGNFALVYIVLSGVALPGERAKTLSLASSVWGLSSLIGPTMGGFIVSYFSWRWIFFLNIPIGILSFLGIALFMRSDRDKDAEEKTLDLSGILLFGCSVTSLLLIFMTGGRDIGWYSTEMIFLVVVSLVCGAIFILRELKVPDPMINLHFFERRNFSLGNGATFMASFTIFAFFAYAPLYIQGSLGLTPMQVGLAMLSLSLGWSIGSLYFGRASSPGNERSWSISGGIVLLLATLLTLMFDIQTNMLTCFLVFLLLGMGMGLVSLSTLILVQNDVGDKDLGIATSIQQFSRSLGGTVGVAICGGFVTSALLRNLQAAQKSLPPNVIEEISESSEVILRPEFHASLPVEAIIPLKEAVLSGVWSVFVLCSIASLLCLFCCMALRKNQAPKTPNHQ